MNTFTVFYILSKTVNHYICFIPSLQTYADLYMVQTTNIIITKNVHFTVISPCQTLEVSLRFFHLELVLKIEIKTWRFRYVTWIYSCFINLWFHNSSRQLKEVTCRFLGGMERKQLLTHKRLFLVTSLFCHLLLTDMRGWIIHFFVLSSLLL